MRCSLRIELGPVNTTGVDGVADENRARTGPPRTALGPWGGDEAEDEGLGYSQARTTTKYGPIFTATLRAGADFTDFRVAPR